MQSHESSPLSPAGEYKGTEMQTRPEFLAHLHTDTLTNEYKYLGFLPFQEVASNEYDRFIHHDGSPFVIITDISTEDVDNHEESFPGRIDYSPPLQTLVLKMTSLPHEEAAAVFDRLVGNKAMQMMVQRILSIRRATRTRTPERQKQADCSYAPRQLPPGRSTQWPTVALEVAFSESREKVKRDAAWWLNRSAGSVLRVITVDIKRPSGNIYITLWKQGLVTNQYPNPDPDVVQEIKIYRGKDGQPPSFTGGDLRISFQQMMLRNPGPGEEDFVFTREELLHDLGEAVWYGMDNME